LEIILYRGKRIDEMIKGDPKGEKTVSLSLAPLRFLKIINISVIK
jgi:hypothetical protein